MSAQHTTISTQRALHLVRNGVFSTAVRSQPTTYVSSRAEDRAAVLSAMRLYGLAGNDARFVGAWCMAQYGYGGGL